MKKIIFLCLISLLLVSCFKSEEPAVEDTPVTPQEEVVSQTDTPKEEVQDENDDADEGNKAPIIEELNEVESVADVQKLEKQEDAFKAKNGLTLNKGVVDLIVWNCEFFEWKKTYYVEEDGSKVERGVYNFKDHAYTAVEEGWCPGIDSKEDKRTMIDTIIAGDVPEKMKQFEGISSLDDIDIEKLRIDMSEEGYEVGVLVYAGLYMLTIDQSDDKKFDKYVAMYNDYVAELSKEYGRTSWDFYHPILFATASRKGGCTQYINDHVVNY